MTSRYYCGTHPLLQGAEVALSPEESRHMLKTMRTRIGDQVIIFGSSCQFAGEVIDGSSGIATVRLGEALPVAPPPSVQMSFLIPWIKGGKTDYLVQKLTELGAARIIIFQARREVAKGDESKIERLSRIALEACKQCERADVPSVLAASTFQHATGLVGEIPAKNRFLLHEREEAVLLSAAYHSLSGRPESVAIASGPEGGWDPAELGPVEGEWQYTSLGPRILRAETAPLAAAAVLLALSGDM